MTKYNAFFIAAAWLLTSAIGAGAAAQGDSSGADRAQVTEAVRSFFAAATDDDLDKLDAVTAPDFYAFDAGGRFTRDALMDMIKAAHAAGKVYVWTVSEPDVHISGDMAWLESAVLEKEEGIWRILFFHSTRAPEKK